MGKNLKIQALFSIVLLSSLAFSMRSQAQPVSKIEDRPVKDVTLEDVWVNFTFYPKFFQGLRSMNDGLHYSMREDKNINKYSYESGELVNTLVEGEKLGIDFQNYTFNKAENKVLLSSDRQAIYRHSYIARYHVWDMEAEKLIDISRDSKQSLADFSPDGNK
nr:DPP IV N-terminal domain-containing protein [Bacteroidota bacterium]